MTAKIYWERHGMAIYHGDALDVLPMLCGRRGIGVELSKHNCETTTEHDDGAPRPCALPSMRVVRALARARLDSRVESWFLAGPKSLESLRTLVWEMLGR